MPPSLSISVISKTCPTNVLDPKPDQPGFRTTFTNFPLFSYAIKRQCPEQPKDSEGGPEPWLVPLGVWDVISR